MSRSPPLNAGRLLRIKSGIQSVAPKAAPNATRQRPPPSAPPATTPPAALASTSTATGRSIVAPR